MEGWVVTDQTHTTGAWAAPNSPFGVPLDIRETTSLLKCSAGLGPQQLPLQNQALEEAVPSGHI